MSLTPAFSRLGLVTRFALFLGACGLVLALLYAMTLLHQKTKAAISRAQKAIPPRFASVKRILQPPEEEEPRKMLKMPERQASLLPKLDLSHPAPLPALTPFALGSIEGLLHPLDATGQGRGRLDGQAGGSGRGGGSARSLSHNKMTMILTEEMVDQRPKLKKRIAPKYPPDAEIRHLEGEVEMRLLVGLSGQVEDAEILQAQPTGVFDAAAREAVLQWRFSPARYQGRPVRAWLRQRIAFRLP